MRNTISILVADEPGELSRIVGLFSSRGYNIETLNVAATIDAGWSRCTIVTEGEDPVIEQILKQCSRLARVREARVVTRLPHIEREMALIDLKAENHADRQAIKTLVDVFRAKVVDISHNRMIIEVSSNKEKIDRLIELLTEFEIYDVTRTGCVAVNLLQMDGRTEFVLANANA